MSKWEIVIRDKEDKWKPIMGWTSKIEPTAKEIKSDRAWFDLPEDRYDFQITEVEE